MSDEEFLALKNQIKEVGNMCYQICRTSVELNNEFLDLNKLISSLESDINKLKSDVSSLEVI